MCVHVCACVRVCAHVFVRVHGCMYACVSVSQTSKGHDAGHTTLTDRTPDHRIDSALNSLEGTAALPPPEWQVEWQRRQSYKVNTPRDRDARR